MKTGSPGMDAVRSSSRGHMDIMTMLFSLLYLPMECCLMALAFVDQLLSDILLSLGRPTPSQCAAFELTTRLDALRDRDEANAKELDTLRQENDSLRHENQQLSATLKAAKDVLAAQERSKPHAAWMFQGAMALLGGAVALIGKAALTPIRPESTAWHMILAAMSLIGAMSLMSRELHSLSRWVYAAVTVTAYAVIVYVSMGVLQGGLFPALVFSRA